MSPALLMSFAAAAAAAAPEAVDFDLARYRHSAEPGCGAGAPGEILVCGRRRNQDPDPDGRLARRYGSGAPLRAEVALGGGAVGRAYVEEKAMDRGQVSRRVMVGVKLRF